MTSAEREIYERAIEAMLRLADSIDRIVVSQEAQTKIMDATYKDKNK